MAQGRLATVARAVNVGAFAALLVGGVIAMLTSPPLPAVLAMSVGFLVILAIGQVLRLRAAKPRP